MKVIVCFNDVRVTVPCGEGTIPVKELINKAVHRYKRATGKGSGHWIEVTSLKSISGGGILDPDDQLNDVVDDREQLIAEFEEQDRPIQHNGGDGASASSTGTTSPDIFHQGDGNTSHEHPPTSALPPFLPPRQNSTGSNNVIDTDVVVTPRDLSLGSNLRVRRGSEPNLNLLVEESAPDKNQIVVGNLRPFIPRRESVRDSDDPRSESSDDDKKVKITMHGSLDRKKFGHNRFTRDALRTSLSSRSEMYRWLEAQEKVEQRNKQKQVKERMGPVEGHDGKDVTKPVEANICHVNLHNDGGPLGIHAVPAYDSSGKDMGLLIQSIEPDRPVHKDGRIQPNDIVVEINGNSLQNVPFLKAQDIFRAAMETEEICLKVMKGSSSNGITSTQLPAKRAPAPPPVLPKPRSHAPAKPSPLTLPAGGSKGSSSSPISTPRVVPSPTPAPRTLTDSTSGSKSEENGNNAGLPLASANAVNNLSKTQAESVSAPKRGTNAPASPNIIKPGPPIKAPKKVPPALPVRNRNTTLTALAADAPLNAVTNTRRIGKKLAIQLKKGPLGLGFSVTSRDNQTDGNCPIYIRNILPKGAAVQDGQLRPGDRLLEVNGIEMTGKTQAEAVALLRMLPEGSVVELVVSRQEEVEERFKVPRKLGDPPVPDNEKDYDDQGVDDSVGQPPPPVSPLQPSHGVEEVDGAESGSRTEKITLHIPLNETGSAGLGVSVKGKTESSDAGVKDLGIFVKTVLQGGAAFKDGRLQVNDQLLEVNGMTLEGLYNTAAMESLRMAMMEDTQVPGLITLTVARRSGSVSSPFSYGESPDSTQMDIMPPTFQQYSSSVADAGVIIHHHRSSSGTEPSSPQHQRFGSNKDMPSPIPPARSKRVAALRERFSESGNGLRNESYTRATHESFNDSGTFTNLLASSPKMDKLAQHLDGKENVAVIGNDTYTLPNKPQRPHSTIGFMHGSRNSQSSASDDDAFLHPSVSSSKEGSDLSPNGDLILPFAREGFGRQSMSEKRKGHLDPRSTEIYKLVKANKENKGGFLGRRVRSFHITGVASAALTSPVPKGPLKAHAHDIDSPVELTSPPLDSLQHVSRDSTYQPNHSAPESCVSTLKRASSLEDLTNPVANSAVMSSSGTSQRNREASPSWRPARFGRARACNDSFRAAVDRSYDALDPALMDTLEEESAESGAFTLEPSNSGRSSISSETTNEDTNSLKRRKAKEKEKKGLLKGFLRFGKGRKSNEEAMRRSRSEERSEERLADRRTDLSAERPQKDRWLSQPYGDIEKKGFFAIQEHNQQPRGRRASQQEQDRIDEEYARLRDHHVTEQRLRSQSVDPSVGRNTIISSAEKNSFHYPIPSSHQQQRMHQQYGERSDPRNFHPAAVSPGPHDFSSNQYFASGLDQDSKMNITKAVLSRAEYIQQLRSQYQQRHRQRQGVYPLDDKEELYELQIQKLEKQHRGSHPSEYDGPHFSDRPSSRQADQMSADQYNSSRNMWNANNSSSFTYNPSGQRHYFQEQQHYQEMGTQSQPGSRPQSRGGPVVPDSRSTYHYQMQNNQYPQHHHPHHYLQHPDDHSGAHFKDHYGNRDGVSGSHNYPMYNSSTQYQFYSGPSQAYLNSSNQYTHHRGSAPYSDPSSAKV